MGEQKMEDEKIQHAMDELENFIYKYKSLRYRTEEGDQNVLVRTVIRRFGRHFTDPVELKVRGNAACSVKHAGEFVLSEPHRYFYPAGEWSQMRRPGWYSNVDTLGYLMKTTCFDRRKSPLVRKRHLPSTEQILQRSDMVRCSKGYAPYWPKGKKTTFAGFGLIRTQGLRSYFASPSV